MIWQRFIMRNDLNWMYQDSFQSERRYGLKRIEVIKKVMVRATRVLRVYVNVSCKLKIQENL